ncbi:MAG TPA: hypothetical protein VEJ67_13340 [Candidatus Cybelea sp.]|nr:hypothetical protein [Candidatus Cybelea sp.]
MTRCLNCGADRTQDVCDSCGLDSSAAEYLLRRRLLNRTGVFLLGAIAFVVAAGKFPPLEIDGILIFMGVLFFATLGIAILVERRAQRHTEVEAVKRVYYGLIPLPWLLALVLVANGAFDGSRPHPEPARILEKFSMPGPVPIHRLIVTSWREGHEIERVCVDRSQFDRFNSGEPVEVRVGGGLVGIPWVVGVSVR